MTRSPFVLTIFGATGDLMQRKLMPAIYKLFADGRIHDTMYIVGVGRRELTHDQFREQMARVVRDALESQFELGVWERLVDRIYYEQGFFEDEALYGRLHKRMLGFDTEQATCVARIYYLATPPRMYENILTHVDVSGLAQGCGHSSHQATRVLVEKPFGRDLVTSQKLDELLASIFQEKQIYRIDHYLGKETIQNILAFRFANGIYEPTWNHKFVDHVQITLAESLGVGERAQFYDGVGALRDVVQNHMLQILAIVAMERPDAFTAKAVRDARTDALKHVLKIDPNDIKRHTVHGQYREGVIAGEAVQGFREEQDIDPTSKTETFVALKLYVGTDRWRGVPFYIRTGKRLPQKVTEVSLHYKKPPVQDNKLFDDKDVLRNVLSMRIEPDEGIGLRVMGMQPGFNKRLAENHMDFHYKESYAGLTLHGAYEHLLLDAIEGDQTLFARTDGIKASWELVSNILSEWESQKVPMYTYKAGTWGPTEARELIEKDKRHWFLHED